MKLRLFVLCLILAATACAPTLTPERSVTLPSPDARMDATIEEVDNGLGFGLGEVYEEIHVHKMHTPPTSHGESAPTVVTTIHSATRAATGSNIKWLSATELLVELAPQAKPTKQLNQLAGIKVTYVQRKAAE